jgi:ribonuclease III family protein
VAHKRKAEHQAKLLVKLIENFALTPKENQIIVRGRNSGSVKGNRRKTPAYNDATALEALLGYVYIADKDRCTEILNFLNANLQLEA